MVLDELPIDLRELVPVLFPDRLRLRELFDLQVILRVNLAQLPRLDLAAEIPDRLEQAFEELSLAVMMPRRHVREVPEPLTFDDLLLLD